MSIVISRVVTDPDGTKHIEQCSCDHDDQTIHRIHWRCPIHGENRP